MNKYLLQLFLLALIAGSTIYGMEQTMPITSASAPVCNANPLSCDQTKSITSEIDKIISPLMLNTEQKEQLTRFIIEQAQQQIKTHAMNQSWLARHKTFLICTALCAVAIATNIMWFVAWREAIKKPADPNSEEPNNDVQNELEIARSDLENIRKAWAATRAERDALETKNNQLQRDLSSGSSNRELERAQAYAASLHQRCLEQQKQLQLEQQANQQLQDQIKKLQSPAPSTQPQ